MENHVLTPNISLTDKELEKLNKLRKAVATGTYHASAEELAAKLILYMMEPSIDPSLLDAGSSPGTGVEGSSAYPAGDQLKANPGRNLKPTA